MPTVIIENKIPYIKGLLEESSSVVYASPGEIDRRLLLNTGAEALIVRTRTRCDANLLEGTRMKFIATATIGTDHIDLEYCRENGIGVSNAPGCNAPAVGQYVMQAITAAYPDPVGMTVGVVGCGHVGSVVARWVAQAGMKVLKCDPPLAEHSGGYVDMETIAREADIITLHTPLTHDGKYPTYHLVDDSFLNSCRPGIMLINAARGEVTDTGALNRGSATGRIDRLVIDCWEHEPEIDTELLERAFIATPHIAGYSVEGKQRATRMAVEAYCRNFGLSVPADLPAPPDAPEHPYLFCRREQDDLLRQTGVLRSRYREFEALRNGYDYRPEPTE